MLALALKWSRVDMMYILSNFVKPLLTPGIPRYQQRWPSQLLEASKGLLLLLRCYTQSAQAWSAEIALLQPLVYQKEGRYVN